MNDQAIVIRYAQHLHARGVKPIQPCRVVRRFMHWLARRRVTLDQIDPPDVQRYLRWRQSLGRCPKDDYVKVRPFCRWLMQQGIVSSDPTKGILCSWVGVPGGLAGYQGILADLFRHPRAIPKYRLLPFHADLERHIADHRQRGYGLQQCQAILRQVLDFHRYLRRHGAPRLLAITPEHLEAFGRAKQRRGCDARYTRSCQSASVKAAGLDISNFAVPTRLTDQPKGGLFGKRFG